MQNISHLDEARELLHVYQLTLSVLERMTDFHWPILSDADYKTHNDGYRPFRTEVRSPIEFAVQVDTRSSEFDVFCIQRRTYLCIKASLSPVYQHLTDDETAHSLPRTTVSP